MNACPRPAGDEADCQATVAGDGFSAEIILSGLNRRVQVLEYEGINLTAMVSVLEARARERGFDKVFLKAPASDQARLEEAGACAEATIAGYFSGRPAVVMSVFLNGERRRRPFAEEQDSILSTIRVRPADSSVPPLPDGYRMHVAAASDCGELADLYARVFDSYPYPITDAEYLCETMRTHVVYRLVRDSAGTLVAAASAETAPGRQSAEMTDFATLPDQRGLGLAQHLLGALEDDMRERAIPNLYTIARARSVGMNRVFHNRGYEWTGTLVNNCHIAGQFEDMHVWCKRIP